MEDRIKLNLGCGDKILSGYVNVDTVLERAGISPTLFVTLEN